ncbi:MAG: hypothetical protein GY791_08430 [Alphaproteobacteria bacterium]|nr:hypothetical protein [Alphaproteobacteria bacterium]
MAFDDPTLEEGWITSWFDRDDLAEKAFVRKIWRILDKMTCRDYKVEYPHTGQALGDTISDVRAGHDALRWCGQGKARMLNGLWRPWDDWEFPNLPWYDGREVGDPPGVCWGGG